MNAPQFIQFINEHAKLLLDLFRTNIDIQSEMSFEEFAYEVWVELVSAI